jgi:hypothetical protein
MSGVGYSTKQFRMFDEFSSFVSQKAEGFLLYPTPDSFSSVVSQPKRIFCGISHYAEGSVSLWDTAEKIIQCRIIFLNSKCLSLTSDENLAKSDT